MLRAKMEETFTRFTRHLSSGSKVLKLLKHWVTICSQSESQSGAIYRINYSQPQRDSHLPIPIDRVEDWYAALKRFSDLALSPEFLVEFKLKPGIQVMPLGGQFSNQAIDIRANHHLQQPARAARKERVRNGRERKQTRAGRLPRLGRGKIEDSSTEGEIKCRQRFKQVIH